MLMSIAIVMASILFDGAASPPVDTASLSERLRMVEQDARATTTSVRVFHLKPQEWSPEGQVWDEADWFERFALQLHRRGRLFRIDLSATKGEAGGHQSPLDFSMFWNGEYWLQRDRLGASVSIDKQPPLNPEIDCLGFLAGCECRSFIGGLPCNEIISGMQVLESEESENRIRLKGRLRDSHVFEVKFRLTPDPVLEFAHLTLLSSVKAGEDPTKIPPTQLWYEVIEWRDVDGKPMPWKAARSSIHRQPSQTEAGKQVIMAARTIIERTAMDITDEQISIVPEIIAGDLVYDKRMDIRYKEGEHGIITDGKTLSTTKPVTFEGTKDLASLLGESGTAATAPNPD